jgi:hypothetical protein
VANKQYTPEEVKEDVKALFMINSHWVYQYGSPTPLCNCDSPFYKQQIKIFFEDKYPQDVTGKAIDALVADGFLKQVSVPFNNTTADFVYRYNIRSIKRLIKQRASIIARFTDDKITRGSGDYAEILFGFMFRLNGFHIVARHSREYKGIKWGKTGHNLDFIIEKDDIVYGVEVKNTTDYMPADEFNAKLEMCKHFKIFPMFPLRCPSPTQFEAMENSDGLALKFKTKIFPPTQEDLVHDMWNYMRLPVSIWKEISPKVERTFIYYHTRRVQEKIITGQ